MALLREPLGPADLAAKRFPCAYHGARDLLLEAQINHCLEAGDPVLRLFNPGPEGVARVAERFKRRHHPHVLAIEVGVSFDEVSKPIGERGATSLRAVLRACPSLQRLDLRHNDLGDSAARTLVSAVEDCTALRWLDLSGNRVSPDGARQLLLACHARGGLHLRGVPVPHDVLPLWLACRTPELELHNLGDRDLPWLAERFAAAGAEQLVEVKLVGRPDRCLGAEGVAKLLGVLEACQSLTSLHLNSHGLTPEGVANMAEPLSRFPRLRVLDLSHNSLGSDTGGSAAALAAMLGKCGSVRALDLSGNGLDTSGFAEQFLPLLLASPPPRLDSLEGVSLARGTLSLEALTRSGHLAGDPQRQLNIHILEAARSYGAEGAAAARA